MCPPWESQGDSYIEGGYGTDTDETLEDLIGVCGELVDAPLQGDSDYYRLRLGQEDLRDYTFEELSLAFETEPLNPASFDYTPDAWWWRLGPLGRALFEPQWHSIPKHLKGMTLRAWAQAILNITGYVDQEETWT